MSGADDLFSGERPVVVQDRLGRAARLLWLALPLQLAGITCFTGVPGAVLALVGWQTADDELGRIEAGVVPASATARARRLRAFGFGQLVFAGFSLTVQLVLFGMGFYDWVFAQIGGIVG